MFGARAWLGQVPLVSRGGRRLGTTEIRDADQDLARTAQAAVLEFWGPMCAPCLQYKPVFDEVASQTSKDILMASVNVNDAPSLVAAYGIEATPTTLFLSDGSELNRVEGKMTKEELVASIASAFGLSPSPVVPAPAVPLTAPAEMPRAITAAPAESGPSNKTLIVGGLSLAAVIVGVALLSGGKA